MQTRKNFLGLALSGGGYRAAVFHLGTLNKLHKMGLLEKVDVLSTISGGSITGAAWCLYKGGYDAFHQEMMEKLQTRNVVHHVLRSMVFIRTALFVLLLLGGAVYLTFTAWAPFAFIVFALLIGLLLRFQFRIFPVSNAVEEAYDAFFYGGRTLKDLKEKPILAIGSSNLHTGRPFTFSQWKMSDSAYTHDAVYQPFHGFLHEDFPIARAVMASSCVPFAFTPVVIDPRFFVDSGDVKRVKPQLVDGGVYDNQGIQKITQEGSLYECQTILVSDAGGQFADDEHYPNTIALLIRTVDLFMYRIKAFQMVRNIYENARLKARPIAYYSLGWRLENCISGFITNMIDNHVLPEVLDAHELEPEWRENPSKYRENITAHLKERVQYDEIVKRDLTDDEWKLARGTSTNLTALSEKRIRCLVSQAENLTELQVKLYCPTLMAAQHGTKSILKDQEASL